MNSIWAPLTVLAWVGVGAFILAVVAAIVWLIVIVRWTRQDRNDPLRRIR